MDSSLLLGKEPSALLSSSLRSSSLRSVSSKALVLCVARSASMAVRHLASRVSADMRAASSSGLRTRDVDACVRAGERAVSELLRERCSASSVAASSVAASWRGLDKMCLREAVGAVAVHKIRRSDIHAWDSFAKLTHLATLIVAGAVNRDTWRLMTLGHEDAADKRRYVYVTILATADAWAKEKNECP